VGVAFSAPAAKEAFARQFADAISTTEPQIIIFVVEVDERVYLWSDADRVYLWDAGTISPGVVAFFADAVAVREVVASTSILSVHAGVVGGKRSLAAIVGASTAGKSTTTIACVGRGLRFYSDERCIISDGLVFPFLRAVTLRPGGRRALSSTAGPSRLFESPKIWFGDADIVARPRFLFDDQAGGPPRALGTAFFILGRSSVAEILPMSVRDALPLLLASMDAREEGLDRIARALREFDRVECHGLQLGTPDETAKLIADVVD
jgi:uncharacterized protein YerC